MDISNYLSKSANLIENTENKQLLFQPGKHNFTKYVNLNLISQLTKQSRYSYGSISYTASLKEWNKTIRGIIFMWGQCGYIRWRN